MTRVRVMTFNIFNSVPDEELRFYSDVWANRSEFNVKTIKRYDPDLIGFQEFQPIHRATYEKHLSGYDHFLDGKRGEGTANFWKTSRFECFAAGSLLLPRSALSPEPELEDAVLMATTWVKLRCRQSGLEFIHLNTHLNDESEAARQLGTELNLRCLTEINEQGALPVIMGGDFNCNPWSPVYYRLLKEGYVDSYRAAGHGDSVESGTFHGFHGTRYFALEWVDQVFWRVDWIMLSGGQCPWQTTSCTIVRDAEPSVYPSNHYPVVAELLMPS